MLTQITDQRTQKLIDKFGVRVLWYPARLCSCVGENNGVRDPECDCIDGYYYDDPSEYTLIRNQISNKTITHNAGLLLQGGAGFTIPRYDLSTGVKIEQEIYHKIARADVLVVPAFSMTDNDVLTKAIRDSVWAFDIESIDSVSQENKVFLEGRDYSYVDTNILWHGINVPDEETMYTVKFSASQQYIVWDDQGQVRGTDSQQIAKRVICVVRAFSSKEKNPIDTVPLDQKIFQ